MKKSLLVLLVISFSLFLFSCATGGERPRAEIGGEITLVGTTPGVEVEVNSPLELTTEEEKKEITENVELSIRKKFRKNIWCKFTKAINQYKLVQEGDCIAVCISGGKDSMLMAKLFQELKLHNKFPFEVKFLVMDPGYSPENRRIIEENATKLNILITVFESDIFESVYHVENVNLDTVVGYKSKGVKYSFLDDYENGD